MTLRDILAIGAYLTVVAAFLVMVSCTVFVINHIIEKLWS